MRARRNEHRRGAIDLALSSLVALSLGPLPTQADKPLLKLEGLDASRCARSGSVVVMASEVELDGRLRKFDPLTYRLVLDGVALATTPTSARRFNAAAYGLEIAVIVQSDLSYQADYARIADALNAFLQRLPKHARVTMITYGWTVSRLSHRVTPAEASAKLADFGPKTDAGSLALAPAIENGLAALTRPPPDPSGRHDPRQRHRVIVLLSNGLNRRLVREIFRELGDTAATQRTPIYPVAYSASDEREPLLNLAELAKRSAGTFRWAKAPDDISTQFVALARQLGRQWLLTFGMPDHCQKPHAIQLSRGILRSNTLLLERQEASALPAENNWRNVMLLATLLLLFSCAVSWVLFRKRR